MDFDSILQSVVQMTLYIQVYIVDYEFPIQCDMKALGIPKLPSTNAQKVSFALNKTYSHEHFANTTDHNKK